MEMQKLKSKSKKPKTEIYIDKDVVELIFLLAEIFKSPKPDQGLRLVWSNKKVIPHNE
jgi:hypothetical protein